MAATIAKATGHDHVRSKYVHRLGAAAAEVEAATWQTFARATVFADGHGEISVTRGERTVRYTFNPEGETLAGVVFGLDDDNPDLVRDAAREGRE